MFSNEEQTFLTSITSRYPVIGINFQRYLSIHPESRLEMAIKELENTPRTGWVRRNVRDTESIKLHTDYVEQYSFNEAPSNINRQRAQAMASVHDIPEAICTDFTPLDLVSKIEKAKLEILAIKVIYEGSPRLDEIIELIKEYEEQKTPESHWVHDVYKLDPLFVALQYEASYPEQMGLFKEFAEYAGSRLKTDKGKALFNDLIENQTVYRQTHRDFLLVNKTTLRGAWAGRS